MYLTRLAMTSEKSSVSKKLLNTSIYFDYKDRDLYKKVKVTPIYPPFQKGEQL